MCSQLSMLPPDWVVVVEIYPHLFVYYLPIELFPNSDQVKFASPIWVLLQTISWITFAHLFLQVPIDPNALSIGILAFYTSEDHYGPNYMYFSYHCPSIWNVSHSSVCVIIFLVSAYIAVPHNLYIHSRGSHTAKASEWMDIALSDSSMN